MEDDTAEMIRDMAFSFCPQCGTAIVPNHKGRPKKVLLTGMPVTVEQHPSKAGELEDRAVEDLPGVRQGVFLPAPVWSGTEILQPCLCKQRTLEGGRCKWKNR